LKAKFWQQTNRCKAICIIIGLLFLLGCDVDSPQSKPSSAGSSSRRQLPSMGYSKDSVSPSKANDETSTSLSGRKFLKDKLSELERFKSNPQFHKFGFGRGGPYYSWLESVEKHRDASNFSFREKVAVGDLHMMGLDYASNRGAETKFSRFSKTAIKEVINQSASRKKQKTSYEKDLQKSSRQSVYRIWTSAGGTFTVRARHVSHDLESVVLERKDNSESLTVPFSKLSRDDHKYLVRNFDELSYKLFEVEESDSSENE